MWHQTEESRKEVRESKMTKIIKFVHKIMEDMENQGFTEGDVRTIVRLLGQNIEENSKRHEMAKPFTVFRE